jgi:acetyltransferase-like isoleucine patch superfamily enzyme
VTAILPVWLQGRELLTVALGTTLADAAVVGVWRLLIDGPLFSDSSGIALVRAALHAYRGSATRLRFAVRPGPLVWRDYYALQSQGSAERVPLPLIAERAGGSGEEELLLDLPSWRTAIPYPSALTAPDEHVLPTALLLPVTHDWDLLFANHIAHAADLARRIRASGGALVRGFLSRRRLPLPQRVALAFSAIDATADIHPTAVVEGSVIGPGCRVGAHAVVRFSRLGRDVRLHDGAKVEWSVIGDRTWLMHDLVLYRCVVERECFLIHGPYQFSAFQAGSAAFATILMDYRPDGRPIRVLIDGQVRDYPGRFLGAVLKPGAKTLGGSLVGPGRVVAENVWLGTPEGSIHTRDVPPGSPVGQALPPAR